MSDLQKWCLQHNVQERIMIAFRNALKAYCDENPIEYGKVFPREDIPVIPVFDKVCHSFSFPEFDFERVQVDLLIEYNESNVGWYRMLYEMDGTEIDDYLVISNTGDV